LRKKLQTVFTKTVIDIDYYLSKLHKDRFLIYLFHGVIKDVNTGIRNYTRKHLPAEEFETLIKRLKVKGNIISMDNVIWHHENGKTLPPYSYAITFDDGFENNYSVAAPILEEYLTPATFYVSTNLVDKNLMTWIDQIEYCFEFVNRASIKLPWHNSYFQLNDKDQKIDCLKDIRTHVKKDPQKYQPKNVVKLIFDQCSLDMVSSNDHPLDNKMNWDQACKLHLHKLFAVGGHSHNHVSLGSLGSTVMKNEIETSITLLKNKAGISSYHYSYPEGQISDYNENVIAVLRKNNIRCCPTAIDGVNDFASCSLFNLKRVMVY
jgi:peptidoglycan/xylan/chitin deacetylase (PgdA/CDA1 family)